jgi:hypothetical protein
MTSFPCAPRFEGFTLYIVSPNEHNSHSTHYLKQVETSFLLNTPLVNSHSHC